MIDIEKTDAIILFNIGNILCGLDILQLQEIKKIYDITTIYGAPEFVKGVINLRGKIVTILDIKKKFPNLEEIDNSDEKIMITTINDEQIGVLVDKVDDIVPFEKESVQPLPTNVESSMSQYFSYVYRWNDKIVSLLDLEAVISDNEN